MTIPTPLPPNATTPRRVLGRSFTVHCDDPALVTYLDGLFRDFAGSEETGRRYSVTERTSGIDVWCDDEPVIRDSPPDRALRLLVWHVNRRALADHPDRVLVHAAVASFEDHAVLLPAAMESGKTTLVAGLVRSGAGYLSDEAAVLDIRTGLVLPFPKPLTIDRGSWDVLPELEPSVPDEVRKYVGSSWHVPASTIRPGAVAGPTAVRAVVAPRFCRAERTRLEPMSPAHGVLVLAENAFNLRERGAAGFHALVDVVRGRECHRLPLGDLEEACARVAEVMAGVGAGAVQ